MVLGEPHGRLNPATCCTITLTLLLGLLPETLSPDHCSTIKTIRGMGALGRDFLFSLWKGRDGSWVAQRLLTNEADPGQAACY